MPHASSNTALDAANAPEQLFASSNRARLIFTKTLGTPAAKKPSTRLRDLRRYRQRNNERHHLLRRRLHPN